MRLRITLRNDSLPEGVQDLRVGYILRSPKGEDLASTNSHTEKVPIRPPEPGGSLTVRFHIELPLFHGGQYSLTPAVAYELEDGEVIVSDRIENALVFELVADRRVHCLIGLDTTIRVETGPEPS